MATQSTSTRRRIVRALLVTAPLIAPLTIATLWLRLNLATPTIRFSAIDQLNAQIESDREHAVFPDLDDVLLSMSMEVSYDAIRFGDEDERTAAEQWLSAHGDEVARARQLMERQHLGLRFAPTFASGIPDLDGSLLLANAGGPSTTAPLSFVARASGAFAGKEMRRF